MTSNVNSGKGGKAVGPALTEETPLLEEGTPSPELGLLENLEKSTPSAKDAGPSEAKGRENSAAKEVNPVLPAASGQVQTEDTPQIKGRSGRAMARSAKIAAARALAAQAGGVDEEDEEVVTVAVKHKGKVKRLVSPPRATAKKAAAQGSAKRKVDATAEKRTPHDGSMWAFVNTKDGKETLDGSEKPAPDKPIPRKERVDGRESGTKRRDPTPPPPSPAPKRRAVEQGDLPPFLDVGYDTADNPDPQSAQAKAVQLFEHNLAKTTYEPAAVLDVEFVQAASRMHQRLT